MVPHPAGWRCGGAGRLSPLATFPPPSEGGSAPSRYAGRPAMVYDRSLDVL